MKQEIIEIARRMGIEKDDTFPKEALRELIKSVRPQREAYAAAALTGLLSNPKYFNPDQKSEMILESLIFKRAFSMADAMIKESNIFNI